MSTAVVDEILSNDHDTVLRALQERTSTTWNSDITASGARRSCDSGNGCIDDDDADSDDSALLWRLGGPLAVVTAMERFDFSPDVQFASCNALRVLLTRDTIRREDAVFVCLLSDDDENDDEAEEESTTATTTTTEGLIVRAGGIGAIVEAVRRFPDHTILHQVACTVLQLLTCFASPSPKATSPKRTTTTTTSSAARAAIIRRRAQRMLVDCDGIPLMISLLQRQQQQLQRGKTLQPRLDGALTNACCCTSIVTMLGALARASDDWKHAIVRAGGLTAMARAAERHVVDNDEAAAKKDGPTTIATAATAASAPAAAAATVTTTTATTTSGSSSLLAIARAAEERIMAKRHFEEYDDPTASAIQVPPADIQFFLTTTTTTTTVSE